MVQPRNSQATENRAERRTVIPVQSQGQLFPGWGVRI